jgi:hypothetical protein
MPIEMPKGLPFSVDTWSLCSKRKRHHFLTHAHKDHTSGISTHFSFPIYSTLLTKTLIFQHYPQVCPFYLQVFAIILSMPIIFFFGSFGFNFVALLCSLMSRCLWILRWGNRWSSMILMGLSLSPHLTRITVLVGRLLFWL